jgi:hypothetical protein
MRDHNDQLYASHLGTWAVRSGIGVPKRQPAFSYIYRSFCVKVDLIIRQAVFTSLRPVSQIALLSSISLVYMKDGGIWKDIKRARKNMAVSEPHSRQEVNTPPASTLVSDHQQRGQHPSKLSVSRITDITKLPFGSKMTYLTAAVLMGAVNFIPVFGG